VPDFVPGPVTVRVPASSANLGPGFDALGLALTLYDEVTAEVIGTSGDPVISITGEGADDVPLDGSHLVHSSLASGLEAMGLPVPALRITCRNAIPHGRGLGSSAAAIVAGLALARRLVPDGNYRMPQESLLSLAAGIEGHPDNVAAALLGGLTIAYGGPGGFRATRLDVAEPLSCVAIVPPERLATEVARGLLPAQVPHTDAAHAAGRAALLVAALTGRPELLLDATEDRLHQSYREPAMPASVELVRVLRGSGVAAVVSGGGPTVLALAGTDSVILPDGLVPDGWEVLALAVDSAGATCP
jgi:homoserine kinase